MNTTSDPAPNRQTGHQTSRPFTTLSRLSDDELHDSARRAAREERAATERVLEHLREVEHRKLFAKRGYSSLWEYVTRELGYDGGAAQRRIQAMRLARELPEVKEALREERVSLTSVAILNQFFVNEKRHEGRTYSHAEKRELFGAIQGLSTRETEARLREISPRAIPRERERTITAELAELRFVADRELRDQIERLKELLSGGNPNPSLEVVLKKALPIAIEKLEKKKLGKPSPDASSGQPLGKRAECGAREPKTPVAAPARESEARESGAIEAAAAPSECAPPRKSGAAGRAYISIHLKRAVRFKAQERCTHVDPRSGRRCESRRDLQIEHIVPLSRGGTDVPDNLTLLCGAHNRYRAEVVLGDWVRRMSLRPQRG